MQSAGGFILRKAMRWYEKAIILRHPILGKETVGQELDRMQPEGMEVVRTMWNGHVAGLILKCHPAGKDDDFEWSEEYEDSFGLQDDIGQVFDAFDSRIVRRRKIPAIHYRVVMSAQMKSRMDMAKHLLEAVAARNVEEHKLHSNGKCKCRMA